MGLKVQVLRKKLIKPSNPTPHHLHHFKLSLFDQLAPPVYVRIAFHYSLDEDNNGVKNCERFEQFEKSLSQILSKFYPLAGRFVKNGFLIHCNDQGVELFEAQVNGDLKELLHQDSQIDILEELLPWDVPPSADSITSPLLAIKINNFDHGGIVLGFCISHIVADAFSFITFLNEWASTCRNLKCPEVLVPSTDDKLSILFPPRMFPEVKFPSPDSPIFLRNFIIDKTKIEMIKEKASSESSLIVNNVSRVLVVTAVIWKALMNVARAKHGQERDNVLDLLMNLRGSKVGLFESGLRFGNFWTPMPVVLQANEGNVELPDLMIRLRNTIDDARKRFGMASVDEIPSISMNYLEEIVEKGSQDGAVDVQVCTSWCRFPCYEADFGWGKPYWISHGKKPLEGICLMDTKDGGGIEAWISLKEEDMIEFKRNLDRLLSAE